MRCTLSIAKPMIKAGGSVGKTDIGPMPWLAKVGCCKDLTNATNVGKQSYTNMLKRGLSAVLK